MAACRAIEERALLPFGASNSGSRLSGGRWGFGKDFFSRYPRNNRGTRHGRHTWGGQPPMCRCRVVTYIEGNNYGIYEILVVLVQGDKLIDGEETSFETT